MAGNALALAAQGFGLDPVFGLKIGFSIIRAGDRLARNLPDLLMLFHNGGAVQRRVNTIATPHPDRRSGLVERPYSFGRAVRSPGVGVIVQAESRSYKGALK